MKKCVWMSVILMCIVSMSGCINNESNDDSLVLIVDDDFNQQTKGFNSTVFASITDAIAINDESSVIQVKSGVYHESLLIEKPVVLRGQNVTSTIIDGGFRGEDIIFVAGNGHLNISGFTLRNAGRQGIDEEDVAGIDLRSSKNTITRIIFMNNTCGLYARYMDDSLIQDNLFVNNSLYGSFLYISCDNNIFENNVFDNNQYSLRIKGSNRCIVKNNIFVNNLKGLYFCCGSNYNIIFGNIFYQNHEWDAFDTGDNRWDLGSIPSSWHHLENTDYENTSELTGNFWDKYYKQNQSAFDLNEDGFIDDPYDINQVEHNDMHPLTVPPLIKNSLMNVEWMINDIIKNS